MEEGHKYLDGNLRKEGESKVWRQRVGREI